MSDPLASVQALADLIGDDVDAEDARLPRALDIASAYIRSEAQESFAEVEDDVVTIPGSENAMVQLPKLPVLGVTSVLVRGPLDSDYAEVTDYTFDTQGRLNRTDGLTWGGVNTSLSITYTHGQEVPEDIQGVTLALAKRLIIFGSRFGDQQLQDPAAQVSLDLTPGQRRVVSRYRVVSVG